MHPSVTQKPLISTCHPGIIIFPNYLFYFTFLLAYISTEGNHSDISIYAYIVPWLGLSPPLPSSPSTPLKTVLTGVIVLFHMSIKSTSTILTLHTPYIRPPLCH
jgi:hypothetical protein